MVSIHKRKRYGALCFIALLAQSFFAAAPDAPAPASSPDWRQWALQEIKAPNYYYALLDIANEEEFATAAEADPARDRITIIREKLAARVNNINNPTPLSGPGEREHVLEELQNAARFLSNANITRLYNLLGHGTYTFIQDTYPPLINAFTEKTVPSILKMTAQFLKSLSLEKSPQDALIDASKPELLTRLAAANVPNAERTLADALGGILFESLGDDGKDKTALQRFIAARPIDPANITIPYKNDVLKEYIRLLQCKLAGPACQQPESRQQRTDGDPQRPDATPQRPDATPVDNKKIIEELEKVNAKLASAKLGIEQARRYLTQVKPAERKNIKGYVTRALDENKQLKTVADAIRNSPIPQYQTFTQLVDAIYKEAGGF